MTLRINLDVCVAFVIALLPCQFGAFFDPS
jgi:hypothetical protein